jgi:hypothetical protein
MHEGHRMAEIRVVLSSWQLFLCLDEKGCVKACEE